MWDNIAGMKTRKYLGFCLLECLFSLTMLSIVIGLIVPSYRELLAKNLMIASVNKVVNGLWLARSIAIYRGEVIRFCKSRDGINCGGNWSDGQIITLPDGYVLRVEPPLRNGDTLTWHSNLGKNDSIEFLPSGLTNGQEGSFYYCPRGMPQFARVITLNFKGRVYVSDTTPGGEKTPCN